MSAYINNLLPRVYNGTEFTYGRCTGRTTALVHKFIMEAYNKPQLWIKVSDHFGSHDADRNLLDLINRTIYKLGYEYFDVNMSKNSIRFNLYSVRQPKTINLDGVKYQEVL